MPEMNRFSTSHYRVPVPSRHIRFRVSSSPTRAMKAKPPKAMPKPRLTYPRDGVIRAHAAAAAQERALWRSSRIENFERVSLHYCRLALGYSDRTVKEEFLYLQLKKKIEFRKADKQSVEAEKLPALVRLVIGEIEEDILSLARKGRRLAQTTPHGHAVVMATIGFKTSKKCFLILEESEDGSFVLKSLKTSAQHARTQRRTFNRRSRDLHGQRRQRSPILH